MRILAINPGSTSTKVAVYDDTTPIMVESIAHSAEDVNRFQHITDQLPFRKQLIHDALQRHGIPVEFDAVIGRGGLSRALEGGVYPVNEQMLHDNFHAKHQHACDLGCILAHEIASEIPGCPSYIADPGRVDELCPEARISGSPLMTRICIWHALNQRAIARRFAREHNTTYEALNLIICHLGGGISVAAHNHGRAIDANNALDGEGPFSPERAGSLPACELIKLCYSGKFTEAELLKRIAGHAGLSAHLGTTDMREIVARIEGGDKHAELLVDAMTFHVSKAIASEGAVLYGKVDAIILTGGIAHSDYITSRIRKRVEYLAPVYIYPGENEMEALAFNALAVLKGEITPKEYM